MKELVCVVALLFLTQLISAKLAEPQVQVYSRNPGQYDKSNVLICHVSGFHPPEIRIDLLKNGQEITEAKQTDLAFEEDWHYHMTKHVPFTPRTGDEFECRVSHMGKTKHYFWEPDM
uniref:Beta-2-microglobulin n=1 Tax=Nothobranchius rachovii TaxID=451742 RepID=A0A1A8QR64_9TELE